MPTLQEAKQAAEQGLPHARLLYEAILQEDPESQEALLGLAGLSTDPEKKRTYYEKVLKINPKNRVAKEGLQQIDSTVPDWVQTLRQPTSDTPDPSPADRKSSKKTKSKPSKAPTEDKTNSSRLLIIGGVVVVGLVLIVGLLGLLLFLM